MDPTETFPYENLCLFGRLTHTGADKVSHQWYVGQGDMAVVAREGGEELVVLLGFGRKRGKAYQLLCCDPTTKALRELSVDFFLRTPEHSEAPRQAEAREFLGSVLSKRRDSTGMVGWGIGLVSDSRVLVQGGRRRRADEAAPPVKKPKGLEDSFDGSYWTSKNGDVQEPSRPLHNTQQLMTRTKTQRGGKRGKGKGRNGRGTGKGKKGMATKGSATDARKEEDSQVKPSVEVVPAGAEQGVSQVVVQKTGSGPMPKAPIYITINVGRS